MSEIKLPSMEEQQKIVAVISEAEKLKEMHQKMRTQYMALINTLQITPLNANVNEQIALLNEGYKNAVSQEQQAEQLFKSLLTTLVALN